MYVCILFTYIHEYIHTQTHLRHGNVSPSSKNCLGCTLISFTCTKNHGYIQMPSTLTSFQACISLDIFIHSNWQRICVHRESFYYQLSTACCVCACACACVCVCVCVCVCNMRFSDFMCMCMRKRMYIYIYMCIYVYVYVYVHVYVYVICVSLIAHSRPCMNSATQMSMHVDVHLSYLFHTQSDTKIFMHPASFDIQTCTCCISQT